MNKWQEVWMLLEVVRLSGGHPQLRNVKDAAMRELGKINAELGPPPNQANLVAQAASVDNGNPSREEEPPVGVDPLKELVDDPAFGERRA